MMQFLNRLKEKRQTRDTSARGTYLRLLKQAGETGDLSEKDAESLSRAAETLGINDERIEADAEFLATFKQASAEAATVEARKAGHHIAATAEGEYDSETRILIDERKARSLDLTRATMTASQARDAAIAAQKLAREMQKARPDLVGPAERTPAHLLLTTVASMQLVAEYPTSATPASLTQYWDRKIFEAQQDIDGRGDPLSSYAPDLIAQRQQEIEGMKKAREVSLKTAHAQDAAIAATKAKIFRLDPDRENAVNIDATDFAIEIAPGQNADEYRKLSAIVTKQAQAEAQYQHALAEKRRVSAIVHPVVSVA